MAASGRSDPHAPTAADPYRDREYHGDDSGYTAVAIRVRPLDTSGHRGSADECILSVDSARGEICCGKEKFCFASVFSGEDNAQLFEAVGRPLVGAALLGYNGTLIAYGQTGSGKTYTIGEASSLGTAHEGVAHRMVRDLFAEMRDDFQHRYEVSMTAVQIHLERIFDLLGGEARECGHAAHQPLPLREDRTHGPYVEGTRSLPCATVDEALSHMRSASGRLAFAATQLNAHSSRSHAICQLTVTKNRAAPQRRVLAGSLSGAPAGRVRSELGPTTLQSSVARLAGAGNAAEVRRCSLQPHAPSLQPRAPSVQPHAPSLPPHAMRQAWRRSSAEMLSHVISTASSSQQLTECRLTLVDLAGSEDVGRSGAASIVKEPWLAFARLATRRSRGL
jgi:hypothetical protein